MLKKRGIIIAVIGVLLIPSSYLLENYFMIYTKRILFYTYSPLSIVGYSQRIIEFHSKGRPLSGYILSDKVIDIYLYSDRSKVLEAIQVTWASFNDKGNGSINHILLIYNNNQFSVSVEILVEEKYYTKPFEKTFGGFLILSVVLMLYGLGKYVHARIRGPLLPLVSGGRASKNSPPPLLVSP